MIFGINGQEMIKNNIRAIDLGLKVIKKIQIQL